MIRHFAGRIYRAYVLFRRGNFPQTVNKIKIRINKRTPIISYRPSRIAVYITSRCNLSCPMCGYHAKNSGGEFRALQYPDMTLERFKHIMSFFPEATSVGIAAEGEPFLNKDIFEMIIYSKEVLNLPIDTSTNGIPIDDCIGDVLSSGLDILNVSLDGTCPEDYNQVRGGSEKQFGKVVSNIQKLCSQREAKGSSLKVNASFIISTSNYRQIPEMMKFAAELGVDAVDLQNAMDFSTEFARKNRPIFDTDKEAVSFIQSAKKPPGLKRVILPTIFRTNYSAFRGQDCCHYPFVTVGVNTDGDINPCCFMNTHGKYGNIFTETDFWNNESYQEIRTKLLNGEIPFKLCETCGVYGIQAVL